MSSENTSGLDDLRALTDRLQVLLRDPHPGLFTWKIALSDVIYDIGQYGGRDIIMGVERKDAR